MPAEARVARWPTPRGSGTRTSAPRQASSYATESAMSPAPPTMTTTSGFYLRRASPIRSHGQSEIEPQPDVDLARPANAGRLAEERRQLVAGVAGAADPVEDVVGIGEQLDAVARVVAAGAAAPAEAAAAATTTA